MKQPSLLLTFGSYLLFPVVFNQVLHSFVLFLQSVLLTQEAVQFFPQVSDVIFTERLQIFLNHWNGLVLQEFPFSDQHLIFLFQRSNLKSNTCG